jgi:hypothetical protein
MNKTNPLNGKGTVSGGIPERTVVIGLLLFERKIDGETLEM